MANNRFNKQVSPKGYAKGGKAKKISKGVKDRNVTSAETIRLINLAKKKKKK
mgnify:CR=1 FL=1